MSVIQGARPKARARYTRPSDYLREYIPPDRDLAKKTFKRQPASSPGFGKKLPGRSPSRLPRVPVPPLLKFLELADEAQDLYEWYRSQQPGYTPGGWIQCRACPPHPNYPIRPGGTVYVAAPNCNGVAMGCLTGQGATTPIGWFSPDPSWPGMAWTDIRYITVNQRHAFRYTFLNPKVGNATVYPPRYIPQPVLPMAAPWRMRDPNNERNRLNDPQPFEPPAQAAPAPNKGGWSNDGTPTRPQNRPPRRHEKEKKTRNIGVQLFNSLDFLSEMSEVIDSIYEALPEKIRKEVEKNWRDEAIFLDKGGQYGVDRADEKLAALWKYWDQLDANQAWKNIAANQLEDQIHGGLHKRLPRNSGNAFEGAEKEIGGFVNEFVELFK